MGSENHLSPTTGVTRINYQKRHSLNMIDDKLISHFDKLKKRPNSLLGLPRLRSKSHSDHRTVSSLVFRTAFIGSKGVGKTSIVHRYLSDTYTDKYQPTVSEIYEKHVMRNDDEAMIMFKIYDTAGDLQFEFPAMFGLTVMEVDMFVLVYSVENRKSFEMIKSLWKEIPEKKCKQEGEVPMVLVGNKSDVSATRRKVSETEGSKLAEEIDCPFFEISAKTGQDVGSIYNALLNENERIENRKGDIKIIEPQNSETQERAFNTVGNEEVNKEGYFLEPVNRPSLKSKKGGSCLLM
eukprot:gene4274-20470_t